MNYVTVAEAAARLRVSKPTRATRDPPRPDPNPPGVDECPDPRVLLRGAHVMEAAPRVTAEELAEYKRLVALKAWRSPVYLEVGRRLASEASDRWRQEDVWGHTFTGRT